MLTGLTVAASWSSRPAARTVAPWAVLAFVIALAARAWHPTVSPEAVLPLLGLAWTTLLMWVRWRPGVYAERGRLAMAAVVLAITAAVAHVAVPVGPGTPTDVASPRQFVATYDDDLAEIVRGTTTTDEVLEPGYLGTVRLPQHLCRAHWTAWRTGPPVARPPPSSASGWPRRSIRASSRRC